MLEAVIAALIVSTGVLFYLRSSRARLYRQLAERRQSLSTHTMSFTGGMAADVDVPSFDDKLVVMSNVIATNDFRRLEEQIEALVKTERSYLPTHKKGGTVAYETLHQSAPDVVEFYLSPFMTNLISRVVGEQVVPTPLHDQSSCSVLFYEQPGDHIGWHYDHNFYKGRHFTVLVPIVNRGRQAGGLSAANLMAKVGAEERVIATPPNTMVVFEGARVLHKVSPITDGERRIVLSLTYCTDPRNSVLQGAVRRIKDTAFFGLRALWT